MRITILSLALFLSLTGCRPGPPPLDGHIRDHAYVNSYFRISYQWPNILNPVDPASIHLPPSPYGNEFLLFAARQGQGPYGVTILAEKLNVQTPHSAGIRDTADFMAIVKRSFNHDPHWKMLSETRFANAEGVLMDELDYMEGDEYSSGVVTRIGKYLIVFKFDAKSAADLSTMTQSAVAMHRHVTEEPQ